MVVLLYLDHSALPRLREWSQQLGKLMMPRASPPRRRKRRILLDTLTILATALSATLVRAFAPAPPVLLRLNLYCKVLNFDTSLGNRPPEPHALHNQLPPQHGGFACGMRAHTPLQWQKKNQDSWLGSGGSRTATFRLSVALTAVARVEERLGQRLLLRGNGGGGGYGIGHVNQAWAIGRSKGCRDSAKWVLPSATMTNDGVRTANTNEVGIACVGREDRGVDGGVACSSLLCAPATCRGDEHRRKYSTNGTTEHQYYEVNRPTYTTGVLPVATVRYKQ